MLFMAWIFFSVAAGMFAHFRRDRSGSGWFMIALLFSPLVAFVLLAILPEGAWVDPAIARARIRHQAGFAIVAIVAVIAIFAAATATGII